MPLLRTVVVKTVSFVQEVITYSELDRQRTSRDFCRGSFSEVETPHCPEHTESFCSHGECGYKNKYRHTVFSLPLAARCTCAYIDLMTSAHTVNPKWFVVSSNT